jgi:hypothetical protein
MIDRLYMYVMPCIANCVVVVQCTYERTRNKMFLSLKKVSLICQSIFKILEVM